MKMEYQKRLHALERRLNATGDDYLVFETLETPDGTRYRVLNNGRVYTPEAFERLVEKREDAVFVTLQSSELSKAAAAAYWEERVANQPSFADLFAENELVERVRREVEENYTGDDKDEEVGRRIADALGTDHEDDAEGDEQDAAASDDDSWVENVTVDSDRATLARYHEWLMEQSEEWAEEMRRRKERLDEGRRF